MAPCRWAAHRGGALVWPENSLLAFRESLALGAPLLELDVHLTRDGDLAVIHDATLERTTDGAGCVADRAAAEVRQLRLRDRNGTVTAERVPMLADVLALVAPSPAGLLLEVKGPGPAVYYDRHAGRLRAIGGLRYERLEERLLAALDAHDMRRRTLVLAFNPDVIAAVRALKRDVRTTLLVAARHLAAPVATADELLDIATALGAADVGVEHTLADRAFVDAVRRHGMTAGVWTVNEAALMRRYADLGVDTVTTDRPDVAAQVFRA